MTSFSVKEGVKLEKRGFQPMRKKLGEKLGVVFSLTVVVTDTGLYTNRSLLDGRAGAGIYASGADETVHESSHYLGTVILRIVWNFVSLTDDDFYTYHGECNFFH